MFNMKKRKKGFTLIELGVSLGVAGSIAMVSLQEENFETSQTKARALGNEMFLYNTGVSRYIAANAGDSSVVGNYVGSNWLKSTSCSGGMAVESYLGCDLIPSGRTVQYGIRPVTSVSYSSDGDISARTVWETIISENGSSDSMAMGVAALVASGNYITQHNDGASGYQSPTVYCPNISTFDASISQICGSDQDVVISSAGVTSSVEPWLRTDHGNTMRHVIEFSETGGRSTEAELRSVENRSGTSWLRQVVNVSRIYNGRGPSSDSLALGGRSGNSIYSNAFVINNSLLSGAIIMDGDVGVMNSLYVNADAFINGNANIGNNVVAGGDIFADSGTVRGGTVRSIGDTVSQRDVIATRNMQARRFIDADNTSTFMDPSHRSVINSLTATGDIRARRFYDQDNTSFYADPASTSRLNMIDANRVDSRGEVRGTLFRDTNNTSTYIDPSSRSVVNAFDITNAGAAALRVTGRINANDMVLNRIVSNGVGCSPNGLVAKFSNGTLANCISGRWRDTSGGGNACPRNATRTTTSSYRVTCPGTGGYSYTNRTTRNQFCPHDQSGWVTISSTFSGGSCNDFGGGGG